MQSYLVHELHFLIPFWIYVIHLNLPNYTLNEIELLAEKIIKKNKNKLFNKYEFMKVIKCYKIAQKYSTKYSENGGNTFREILKLCQFIDKCGEIPL